jgi:hypothetical protein
MALTYDSGHAPVKTRLPGTRHLGLEHTRKARALRKALLEFANSADWRPTDTPDSVCLPIIESASELNPDGLYALAFAHGVLVRHARR